MDTETFCNRREITLVHLKPPVNTSSASSSPDKQTDTFITDLSKEMIFVLVDFIEL